MSDRHDISNISRPSVADYTETNPIPKGKKGEKKSHKKVFEKTTHVFRSSSPMEGKTVCVIKKDMSFIGRIFNRIFKRRSHVQEILLSLEAKIHKVQKTHDNDSTIQEALSGLQKVVSKLESQLSNHHNIRILKSVIDIKTKIKDLQKKVLEALNPTINVTTIDACIQDAKALRIHIVGMGAVKEVSVLGPKSKSTHVFIAS